jgi:hypothetical protein
LNLLSTTYSDFPSEFVKHGLDAIEQLRERGEALNSDNLPADVPLLDQMINARWITGVVIRSKSTPWNERIIGIDLTPLGRKMLAQHREANPATQ